MTFSSIQTINERLAIEVMGWEDLGDEHTYIGDEINVFWKRRDGKLTVINDEFPHLMYEWNPMESIEQAMMVVEKMCQTYNSLELHIWRGSSVDPKAISAQAIFTHEGDKYLENAETPAEAICLAAIKALEG